MQLLQLVSETGHSVVRNIGVGSTPPRYPSTEKLLSRLISRLRE